MIDEKFIEKLEYNFPGGNWNLSKIKSQNERYQLSEQQILDILDWHLTIKGNDPKKCQGGIGIIPYIKSDYFVYKTKEKEKEKVVKSAIEQQLEKEKIPLTFNYKKHKPAPIEE